MLAENTITLAFSTVTKFAIKFLENAWGFHRGSLRELNDNEMF